MNVFEFILGIIIVSTIATLYRAHLKHHRLIASTDHDRGGLIEEVRALRERVATLERITIEKESSLERQIEQLRDR
jgi:uncharacterized protein YlxW (UPF0749 family)